MDYRDMKRMVLIFAVIMGLISFAPSRLEANPAGSGENAMSMIADFVVCRPIGILATLGGSALYILSYPFTYLGKNTEDAKRTFIEYPFHYTFRRPLGDFDQ